MHLLTQSALLRALGWSLFNSLWQMSLLWAFYHLFLLVFKQLPARARHGLALFLLATGFCWSAITFITSYLFTADQPLGAGGFLNDPTGSTPFSLHGFRTILEYGRRLTGELLPWCSSLYLLILAGLLLHYSRQYIRTRRIVREGLAPLASAFDTFVAAAGRRMGIRANVNAYLSSLVQVPVTLGFLKPVILLPVSMVTQLTTEQIEAILIHELAHIRRKDYLLNLLSTVMELLFFFNPFTRLLINQLKKEREHCCDDTVLEFRYDPHGYVSALLSLARQQQQSSLALAAIGGGGEQLLLQRARKILQQKRADDRPGARPLIGLLLTALISVLLLGGARPIRNTPFAAQPAGATQPRYEPLVFDQPIPGQPGPGQPVAEIGQRPPVLLESMSFVIINNPAPQPIPTAPPTMAIRLRRHPLRTHLVAHTKRPSQDLLDAMLAESFPLLNTAGPGSSPAPTYTNLTETAHRVDRDFSIGKSDFPSPASQPQGDAMTDNMPFVPHSSFSFQYTDTLPPGEKLALMQDFYQQALRLEIARIRQELKQQMIELRNQEAAIRRAVVDQNLAGFDNVLDIKSLQQSLQQQLQERKAYLLNLEKLQRQLQKKAARHLTIVYI